MSNNFAKIGSGLNLGTLASDPPSGKGGDVYFNATFGKMRFWNTVAGIWQNVGSGSGSGSGFGINFVQNGDFEEGTVAPFLTYADTPGPVPTDGFGGSPTATLMINNVNPLTGFFDGIFTKGSANMQGNGFAQLIATDFIHTQPGQNLLQIDFDYKASANFVPGPNSDIQIFIYDVTNTVLIPIDNPPLLLAQGHFTARFNGSTSQSYRLIFHVASTNALPYTLEVDNISLGNPFPQQVASASDKTLWSGYHDNGYQWQQSNGSFGDFTNNAVGTFVETDNNNFGTVVTAPGTLPGIQFTPRAGVKYRVVAKFADYQDTNNSQRAYRLWDGTTVIDSAAGAQNANPTDPAGGQIGTTIVLEGYWTAPASVPATITIQASESGGTSFLEPFGTSNAIQWLIEQALPDVEPVGISSKVSLAQLIVGGTQVTGRAPAAYGEYRALYRSSTSATSLADATPSVGPTSADGFLLYGNVPGATAGNILQPTVLQAFIGLQKNFQPRHFASAGMVDEADIGHFCFGVIETGLFISYNPNTGVLTFDGNYIEDPSITTRNACSQLDTVTADPTVYIDAIISENPIGVGLGGYVGEVKMLAGSIVPPGALEIGNQYSRTLYSRLFAVIGTNWGVGDGSTTFDTPPRGVFPRFWDHGAGNDPDAGSRYAHNGGNSGDNVGSFQGWQNLSHNHLIFEYGGQLAGATPFTFFASDHGGGAPAIGYSGSIAAYSGGNQANPINGNFLGVIVY
jgi:hypothetical protein